MPYLDILAAVLLNWTTSLKVQQCTWASLDLTAAVVLAVVATLSIFLNFFEPS
jgi:hypothetical protein